MAVKWLNTGGKYGHWTAFVHGNHLRINYGCDLSGEGRHYRITSRYSNEMLGHQFYKTLREAQEAAVTMFTKHLKERETQGLKINWDEE